LSFRNISMEVRVLKSIQISLFESSWQCALYYIFLHSIIEPYFAPHSSYTTTLMTIHFCLTLSWCYALMPGNQMYFLHKRKYRNKRKNLLFQPKCQKTFFSKHLPSNLIYNYNVFHIRQYEEKKKLNLIQICL
jgi:hypothetical protein